MSSSLLQTPQTQEKCQSSGGIRGFYGGPCEIFGRVVRILLPALIFAFLIVALVYSNTPCVKELPKTITNCSVSEFYTLDRDSLRVSVQIFSGIYLGISFIAVVIKTVIFLMKLICPSMVKDSWKTFNSIESIMYHILTHLYIGGLVGSFYLANTLNLYGTMFQDELDDKERRKVGILSGMMWACFGVFISAYFNEFFGTHETAYVRTKIRLTGEGGCGNKCESKNGVQMDEKKADF